MPILGATALYAIWTLATYLLEGRRKTFLRPASSTDRIVYAGVANMMIGTLGSILMIRWSALHLAASWPGFPTPRYVALSLAAGVILGAALFAVQRPATWNARVLLNAYAQTLVVSIAEVLVCWVVLGSAVMFASASLGPIVSMVTALIVASSAFGIYHLGHTAPFNTTRVVIGLSVVGLITGAFFVVSGDVYGTIAFHNFLAVKGVTTSLSERNLLGQFRRRQPALVATAAVAVAVLIAADVLLITRTDPP